MRARFAQRGKLCSACVGSHGFTLRLGGEFTEGRDERGGERLAEGGVSLAAAPTQVPPYLRDQATPRR